LLCVCIIGRRCSGRVRRITHSEVHVSALRLEIEPVRFSDGARATDRRNATAGGRGDGGGETANSIRTGLIRPLPPRCPPAAAAAAAVAAAQTATVIQSRRTGENRLDAATQQIPGAVGGFLIDTERAPRTAGRRRTTHAVTVCSIRQRAESGSNKQSGTGLAVGVVH